MKILRYLILIRQNKYFEYKYDLNHQHNLPVLCFPYIKKDLTSYSHYSKYIFNKVVQGKILSNYNSTRGHRF
jgi:hypothetical protein